MPLMSLRQYAKRRGVTPMAVSLAVRDNRLVASVTRDANGQPKINDPFLADREWEQNTQNLKAPAETRKRTAEISVTNAENFAAAGIEQPSPPSPMVDEADANADLKYWQAKLAELKFREAARHVIPVEEVAKAVRQDYTDVRSKLLGLPSRIRQQLPHLTAADTLVIEDLIRESLDALANEFEA